MDRMVPVPSWVEPQPMFGWSPRPGKGVVKVVLQERSIFDLSVFFVCHDPLDLEHSYYSRDSPGPGAVGRATGVGTGW